MGRHIQEDSTMRPIHEIADEIRADWKKVHFAAKPYLDAMLYLNHPREAYGHDSAESVIRYFLCNASSWRGETAKRIKAELKGMIGVKA